LVFGPEVLLIFGKDFNGAFPVLVILAFGEMINALTGPAGNLLVLTGQQRISVRILTLGVTVCIGFNLWLIPLYGAVGAAFSMALGLIVINILRALVIRSKYGIVADIRNIVSLYSLLFMGTGIMLWLRYGAGINLLVLAITAFSFLGLLTFWWLRQDWDLIKLVIDRIHKKTLNQEHEDNQP